MASRPQRRVGLGRNENIKSLHGDRLASVNGVGGRKRGKENKPEIDNIRLSATVDSAKPFKRPIDAPPESSDEDDDALKVPSHSSDEDEEPGYGNIKSTKFGPSKTSEDGGRNPPRRGGTKTLARNDSEVTKGKRIGQVPIAPRRRGGMIANCTNLENAADEETKIESEGLISFSSHLRSDFVEESVNFKKHKSKKSNRISYGSQPKSQQKAFSSSATVEVASPEKKKSFKAPLTVLPDESEEASPEKKFKKTDDVLSSPSSDVQSSEKKRGFVNHLALFPESESPSKRARFESASKSYDMDDESSEFDQNLRIIPGTFDTSFDSVNDELPELRHGIDGLIPEEAQAIIDDIFSQTQRPGFKVPMGANQLISSSHGSSREALSALMISSQLSTVTSRVHSDSEDEDPELEFARPTTKCPLCGVSVPSSLLQGFSKGKHMKVSRQAAFCRHHNRMSAQKEYSEAGYPEIDWQAIDARIRLHHKFIRSILDGSQTSYYRDVMADGIKTGKVGRTVRQTVFDGKGAGKVDDKTQSLIPGYYGSRGLRAISENLMDEFSATLRKVQVRDRLVASRGVTGYVQGVLVPEVAARLVEEDLNIGEDEARAVLRRSAALGEVVNEEEAEVIVRNTDVDEEDEDGAGEYA